MTNRLPVKYNKEKTFGHSKVLGRDVLNDRHEWLLIKRDVANLFGDEPNELKQLETQLKEAKNDN